MIDYYFNFLSNLVDSGHRLITLIVLSKYKGLFASDVVNFIPNTTRSGLVQYLTLIGYSSSSLVSTVLVHLKRGFLKNGFLKKGEQVCLQTELDFGIRLSKVTRLLEVLE